MDDAALQGIDLDREIAWDGAVLSLWAHTGDGRVRCEIPRAMIHATPPFSDALDREIARDRAEIVNRMRPVLLRKIAIAKCALIQVTPADLQR